MTSLSITADTEKKRLKFDGDKIALGEKVHVDILGVEASPTLRLRVLAGQKTIAMFPLEETDKWDGNTCVLNLNTVQAEMIKGGYGLFVLEDMDIPQLYGCGESELLPWPKERGEDVPYDLGNYPDVIEYFREEMKESFGRQDKTINSKFSEFDNEIKSFTESQTKRQDTFETNVNKAVDNKVTQQQLTDEETTRRKADDELSKRISDNFSEIKNLKTDVSNNENAIKDEVEARKSAVETEKQRALRSESLNSEKISQEETRAKEVEKQLGTNINVEIQKREELQGVVNTLIGNDKDKTARTIAGEEVMKLVDGAPDSLNTLKEIADYIAQDKSGAAAMTKRIAENAEAIAENAEAIEGKADKGEVVSVKGSQSFSDDDKERASVNGGYRYLLHVPESELETVDGEECLKYSVKDYAINIITLDTSSRVRIHLPAPVDKSGRCRDFVVKLKITSDPLPTIEFVKSDEDKSIGFESSDEEWATIEPGINYFTFTETERNA